MEGGREGRRDRETHRDRERGRHRRKVKEERGHRRVAAWNTTMSNGEG